MPTDTTDLDTLATQLAEARTRIDATMVTEWSRDRVAAATVRANGAIVDLQLSDHATRMDPSRLATTVLACLQRAQARIADEVQTILGETVPGDDPILADVVAEARNRYPAPRAAARPPIDAMPKQYELGALED